VTQGAYRDAVVAAIDRELESRGEQRIGDATELESGRWSVLCSFGGSLVVAEYSVRGVKEFAEADGAREP